MATTLTADLFISVDGWAKGEHSPGYFGYFGPDLDQWITAELSRPQHVLMGRRTYSALADLPEQHRDDGYHRMAAMPTTVFSRTVATTDWPNANIESRDVVRTVGELKQTSDLLLRTMGSLSLVRQLLNAGIVDRLRLMIFPLLVGSGGRESAFEAVEEADLTLASQCVLDQRLILAEYTPTDRQIPRLT